MEYIYAELHVRILILFHFHFISNVLMPKMCVLAKITGKKFLHTITKPAKISTISPFIHSFSNFYILYLPLDQDLE